MMSYLRRQKITQFAKFAKPTSGPAPYYSKNTTFLYVFEKEDKIVFSLGHSILSNIVDGKHNRTILNSYFAFSCRTLKNGSKSFYFRTFNKNGVRICHPNRLKLALKYRAKRPEPINRTTWNGVKFIDKTIEMVGLSKTASLKLYRFIKKFLRRHKVNIKYLSKDPFILMSQVCYPSLTNWSEVQASKIVTFGELKKPLNKVLRTNGSATRRAFIECLGRSPHNSKYIFQCYNYLRRKFSLDQARLFLETFNYAGIIPFRNPKDIVQEINNHFPDWSYERVVSVLQEPNHTFTDTIRMLGQVDVVPEYTTLRDLHDKLARQIRRRQDIAIETGIIPKYEQIDKLVEEWDDPEYNILLPTKGSDLIDWSEQMNNCVASYCNRVLSGEYYIFAITKDDQIVYNVGLSHYTHNKLEFNQWSGHRNQYIPNELQDRFKQQLKKVNISCY